MTSNLVFMRGDQSMKKPLLLNDGVFLIYTTKKLKFPCSEFTKYDTEIVVTLPNNSRGFFCSKYRDNMELFYTKKRDFRLEF